MIVRVSTDLREFIPEYLEHRKKDAATLKDALARRDFESIRVLAHKLRGSGGAYGFDLITDASAKMEAAAAQKDAAGVEQNLSSLSDYLAQVEVVFE